MNRTQWLAEWGHGGKRYNTQISRPSNGDWVQGREIRVFSDGAVPQKVVEDVCAGIYATARRSVGLSLDVNDYKSHDKIPGLIDEASTSGRLDADYLSQALRKVVNGTEKYANVIVTAQNLKTDDWGWAEFSKGYMILSLPPETHPSPVLRNRITRHETGHLLGLDRHHTKAERVEGYEPVKNCNMYQANPEGSICAWDREALQTFWKGLEQDFEQKLTRL